MSSQSPFSHLDSSGRAHMVDVSEKAVTRRIAEASCRVVLTPETTAALDRLPKGDAIAVARLVLPPEVNAALGPAANSGASIFLHGGPGNGKTAIAERLGSVVSSEVYLPYAIIVARLAGVQGAKRTAELVPLAHPLPLDQVEVEVSRDDQGVEIRSRVVVTARTGAEMEALVACSTAALALYDMVKAVERQAVITDLRLERKSGGRSGDFRRQP